MYNSWGPIYIICKKWFTIEQIQCIIKVPDNQVHGANMGPALVLLAPDGPHFGPMNLAMRGLSKSNRETVLVGSVKMLSHAHDYIKYDMVGNGL